MAHQKLRTIKPGTIQPASSTIRAFIKKVNKPRVTIFKGRVRSRINGLTNKFKIPKTIATTIATQKLGNVIPADKI